MRVDRLPRAVAARRQAVRHRQQRHVYLHRLARAQVVVHARTRERLRLVYEEAQAQVVARERSHVRARALARPQPAQHVARELRAAHVVADERHAAAKAVSARERLGRVVQQRAPAQRLRAREPVGQGLRKQRRHIRAVLADHLAAVALAASHRFLEVDRLLQHLERVLVDVRVVKPVLLDALQRVQLREHHRERAHRPQQPQSRDRARAGDDAAELRKLSLSSHALEPRRRRARRAQRLRVGLEPKLDIQAHHPQHPQRVVAERARTRHPQPPPRQVREAAQRVDRLPSRERLGDRVDREVAQREVLLQRPPA